MSHSETHLVNSALLRLGAQAITDLGEDTAEGRISIQLYEQVRDEVVSSYPWNSAIKRALLNLLVTTPIFQFTNAFQLPADFLRLHAIDITEDFRIEGKTLVTDAEAVNIIYVFRIINVADMDEMLKRAISTRLSMELALPLTGSERRLQQMTLLHQATLAEARLTDAVQSPTTRAVSSEWLDARRGNVRLTTGFNEVEIF